MSQGAIIATAAEVPRRGARFRSRWSERPLLWITPLAFLLFASYIYPALEVIRFSFTDATLLNPDYNYTLETYGNATANPDLPDILRTTLIFVAASVFFQLFLGLLVAMALHRGMKRGLIGVTFLRIVILASWIVPGVASGIVWQLMFSEATYGFLDGVLKLMGLPAVAWLSSPGIAIWSTVLANVWRGTAFSMILLYAGLVVIPGSLYEAAAVDGATAAQRFRLIILPLMLPAAFLALILRMMDAFRVFDIIFVTTSGGPADATNTLMIYGVKQGLEFFNIGAASAVSTVIVVCILVMAAAFIGVIRPARSRHA